MLENLCLNKRKNKTAKFSESLNALSIAGKKSVFSIHTAQRYSLYLQKQNLKNMGTILPILKL
jgi:hypothetical protein